MNKYRTHNCNELRRDDLDKDISISGDMKGIPTPEQMEEADIDLMVGASIDSVAMVEGEMMEVSENEMIEAIKIAHDAIKTQCQAQLNLAKKIKTF